MATTWTEHLSRIKKWVRDPSGNVFGEPFLRRLWNDEQQQLVGAIGPAATVKAIRIHPEFYGTYTHDWEWPETDHTIGDVYPLGLFYDAGELTYTYVWEPESIKAANATTYEQGYVYTQPWEAWQCGDPFYPPPIPLPKDFDQAIYLAYDRSPVEPTSQREAMADDEQSWKTRAGDPITYWRDDKNSNWIRLYPLPTLTWQDTEEAQGDPDAAEYADVAVDVDNNLLIVYRAASVDVEGDFDTNSTLPEYFYKYIEYGVAERALRANTDGRIESLADYWGMRKKAGYEVIKRWKRLKLSDRDIGFKTKEAGISTSRPKYPRLPSTYPDAWV